MLKFGLWDLLFNPWINDLWKYVNEKEIEWWREDEEVGNWKTDQSFVIHCTWNQTVLASSEAEVLRAFEKLNWTENQQILVKGSWELSINPLGEIEQIKFVQFCSFNFLPSYATKRRKDPGWGNISTLCRMIHDQTKYFLVWGTLLPIFSIIFALVWNLFENFPLLMEYEMCSVVWCTLYTLRILHSRNCTRMCI